MTVYTPDMKITRGGPFCDWLQTNGLTPSLIYRLEVNGDTATVYEYVRDLDNNFYIHDGEIAKRDPYTVTVTPL